MNTRSLERRARSLSSKLQPRPRMLVLALETGQDVPATVRATLRPGDRVLIEEIPPGYFGNLEGYRETCQQV